MRIAARRLMTAVTAVAAASLMFLPARAAAGPAGITAQPPVTVARPATAATPGQGTAAGQYQPLPGLPVNSCHDSSLPRSYGTNFPTPADPSGFGFANQTVIGWESNYYAPFAYLSGAYFARGVPDHYTEGGQTYCGAMYSFGAYTYGLAPGQAPAPGSVHWTMADGYLPAMITSFTRGNVAISITDFANRQVIAGNPVELVYTRITVANHGPSAVTVPAGQSGPGLVPLGQAPDTVPPGQAVRHDFVAAVDTFGGTAPLPGPSTLAPAHGHGALGYAAAYAQMARYWNERLSVTPRLSLPDLTLPGTNNLADPGTAIGNAYKAAFVYTRIVQSGASPFSGADNYDWLLNHDVPGILANRFALGDFTDAQNLLLTRAHFGGSGLQRGRRELVLGRAVADAYRVGGLPADHERHWVRGQVLPRRCERPEPVGRPTSRRTTSTSCRVR